MTHSNPIEPASTDPAVDLSVVILNWNSRRHLETCLSSLRQFCADAELVVVDNSSRDQPEIATVCQRFDVDWFLPQSENLGVARGRNLGVSTATRNYICSLDVDTEVTSGALQGLVEVLKTDKRVGLCAPQLRSFGGVVQFSCRQFPTVYTKLLRLAPRLDWFDALAREEMREMERTSPACVDWVIGACQVFRRAEFLQLNGYHCFSTFGSEDIDFCLRMWLSGSRVVYWPAAVVYHWEQRAARSLFRKNTFSHLKSLVQFFAKHRYAFSRDGMYRRIESHPRSGGSGVQTALARENEPITNPVGRGLYCR